MKDIKPIVAKNIARLRQAKGMTQIELAEKLNYSDKAVSKWERAESMPDISVLVEIADLFGVPLDHLVRPASPLPKPAAPKAPRYDRRMITGVSVLLVWLIAILVYVILSLCCPSMHYRWLCFVCAVPVSCIVWLVFNSLWFNRRRNYLIVSLLMWSTLTCVQLSLLPAGHNIWMVYLLGIPGQIIILLWSRIRKQKPV